MLPYFMRYDHINYSRWDSINLADANQHPDAVREELKAVNFVVKRLAAQFNQVYPDQGQEWLNATGKIAGGIVGITKKPSTLTKWSLS